MSASAILKLQASGFTADQVSALAELIDTQAATKADIEAVEHRLELKIADLKTELKGDLAAVRTEIASVRTEISSVRTEIATAKNDTLRWIFGFNISLILAVFAIVKYIH